MKRKLHKNDAEELAEILLNILECANRAIPLFKDDPETTAIIRRAQALAAHEAQALIDANRP